MEFVETFGAIIAVIVGVVTLVVNMNKQYAKLSDKVDGKIGKVDTKVGNLDARFVRLDSRIAKLDLRFDGLDTRIDKLDTKIEQLRVEVKEDINSLREETRFTNRRIDSLYEQMTAGFNHLARVQERNSERELVNS